ncbi:unnamed protein product [Amoebophrya sp. A25]|nr:unnamed protein product [Amoebophrya sp. A25]|eukprot:GSA25T00011972001.1
MGSAAAPGGGGILGSPTATSSAGSGGVIHHHPATSSQFFSTSSSATTSSKTSAQPQQPIANAVDPLDGASLAKHSEHLLNYFRNIVESAFSPEFQAWFPPSEVLMTSSGNMIEWKCQDVIQLAYEIRRQALGQLMLIREEFEALVEQWPANAPALNMYWVPGVVTNRVSSLMGGVVAFVSALFHLRPECVPRVFKDQMLLLLYNWDSLHHSGLMQQYFWSFHYHSHSYLLDHPARPAEADIAYMGSMLSQTQAMLERDLQVSFDAVKYFVASGEITDPAINLIAVNELEKYGDNIDSEGKFTSFEILYRNIFKRWYLDRGLVQEFARFIAGEPGAVGSHVLDLGAGGGHYTTALNQTGLVTASGYDATVNLLPIEVDLAKELAEFTHGKVNFFDVAKEIPKRSDGKPSMTPADYVFCLEVAEHIPAGASASLFLENLNYLATKGMVISWAGKELCGLGWGHVNCLDMDVKDFIEARTDFLFDANVTEKLRSRSEISWIQKSVSFFRKKGELLHLAEVVHKVEEQVDQTGGAEMTAAAQYYEKVASIRAKAEEMKPTEETKHQKDREKYTQMILNAPVPTVFPRQHAPMGTTEGWVSAPGGKNTPSGMPTTTTVAFSPPAAAPQQSAGMLSTGGLGTGQRPSGASVPPFPSVNLASVGTSASTSVPNNNNIRIMPQQQQHQQSSSSIDQQQHPKLIDLRNVASQASTQSQQTQAKFAGVSPSMIADYEAQGGMGKKIENTIHDARAAIQRGILELDAINEQHRSRRPTGEPAPDLLNYEKVFDALERDYASSEARKTLGLHPRDIKPVDGGQRSEL